MRCRGVACLAIALLVSGSCAEPAAPERVVPTPGPGPGATRTVHALRLEPMPAPGAEGTFVGGDLTLRLTAYDARGLRVTGAEPTVVISDPLVATLEVLTVRDISGSARDIQVALDFLREGPLEIVARLGAVTDTFSLIVGPRPPASTTVRVDSFVVVEYRPDCASTCPYIAYAPVLRLTNQSSGGAVSLVWARLALVGNRSSRCAIDSPLASGESREYGRMDPYLWNNGLLLVALEERFPAGIATLEMVVRTPEGHYEMVEATGPVLPLEAGAALPGPSSHEWGC